MRIIGRLVFSVFSNAAALLITSYLVGQFVFVGTLIDLLIAAGILTIINTFVRPLLKLLFGPLIILTLGLFIIVINALTLYLLDVVSSALTIQGYLPLLIATIIFGVVNAAINLSARFGYRRS